MRVEQTAKGKRYVMCDDCSCCPTVTPQADGSFEVRDDHGGKIVLTREQFLMLRDIPIPPPVT